MNVASLELCKELHELSGWESGIHFFGDGFPTPKYDLGCLLRKLPAGWFGKKSDDTYYATWKGEWNGTTSIKKIDRNNPEDAAAKLAIELFKQGILTKS